MWQKCQYAINYLKEKKIPYQELNISKSEADQSTCSGCWWKTVLKTAPFKPRDHGQWQGSLQHGHQGLHGRAEALKCNGSTSLVHSRNQQQGSWCVYSRPCMRWWCYRGLPGHHHTQRELPHHPQNCITITIFLWGENLDDCAMHWDIWFIVQPRIAPKCQFYSGPRKSTIDAEAIRDIEAGRRNYTQLSRRTRWRKWALVLIFCRPLNPFKL